LGDGEVGNEFEKINDRKPLAENVINMLPKKLHDKDKLGNKKG